MVTLVPIDRHNWRATLEVRVQPERLPWVASREPVALMLLAKSYVRPDGQDWHPLAVLAPSAEGTDTEGTDTEAPDTESPDAVVGVLAAGLGGDVAWLHHVLIDERQQGRGYGRAAMLAVGEWLRREHPGVDRVGLSVLPDNTIAFALYRSLGFAVIGETVDGQLITLARVDELR